MALKGREGRKKGQGELQHSFKAKLCYLSSVIMRHLNRKGA
jgi:hypothetical protein